jgi:hypothetical protein
MQVNASMPVSIMRHLMPMKLGLRTRHFKPAVAPRTVQIPSQPLGGSVSVPWRISK